MKHVPKAAASPRGEGVPADRIRELGAVRRRGFSPALPLGRLRPHPV